MIRLSEILDTEIFALVGGGGGVGGWENIFIECSF